MPSSRAAPAAHVSAGPSSGSAPAAVSSGLGEHGPLLGQHDELRAGCGGSAREAVRGLEVAIAVRGRVELHGGGPHGECSSRLPWIDPSVNPLRRGYRAFMRTPPVRAWRGEGGSRSGRPEGIPLPPARLPLTRGGRPLKRWRWVGAFSADAMLCAARARIGGVPVTWWAVWDGERLHERTHRRAGAVRMAPGHVRAAALELRFEEDAGVEVVSPHGAQYIWTRKQGGIPMRGTVLGRPVRGLRLRRRHGRLPRAPHVLALVGRRRRGRVRRARRVEPRGRRARRARDLRAHGLGRRHAAPRRAARVRRRPLRGRGAALPRRRGARPPRAAARVRVGLRAAVRPLHRLAAARRDPARGLGCDWSATTSGGSLCKSTQGVAPCVACC